MHFTKCDFKKLQIIIVKKRGGCGLMVMASILVWEDCGFKPWQLLRQPLTPRCRTNKKFPSYSVPKMTKNVARCTLKVLNPVIVCIKLLVFEYHII